jgi:hypothetical protein
MATINKDFKVKHGLIVEGASGTINNQTILTEVDGDAYILGIVGGESFITSVSNEFDVSEGKELSIDRTVVDAYYDAAGSAAQALEDAEAYADTAEADAKAYTDTRETAITTAYEAYADTAEADAKAYADAEIAAIVGGAPELLDTLNELAAALQDNPDVIADLQGIAAGKQDQLTAGANIDITGATISVTGLDTDDVEEGSTNQYYTTTRAKIDAAALLTGATLENITITGDEDGLTITAENGVADSDTDDLTEGTTNLYFTDQRAVDALEAVTPNFVEIDINSIATQIAATTEVATASTVTAHAFPKADYRSAEYLVKVAHGTHTEISKVLLTLDTSDNIAITEYAIVGTNGSASTISADVSGTDVRLRVTTANNDSDVTVVGTLVA